MKLHWLPANLAVAAIAAAITCPLANRVEVCAHVSDDGGATWLLIDRGFASPYELRG